jgi:hypothetical protein
MQRYNESDPSSDELITMSHLLVAAIHASAYCYVCVCILRYNESDPFSDELCVRKDIYEWCEEGYVYQRCICVGILRYSVTTTAIRLATSF